MSRPSGSPFAGLQLDDDDSIRLLELQPGQRDSPIIIRLFIYKLTVAPSYEALSYAWGDLNETEGVQVKPSAAEMGPNAQLHVTTSCVAALQRLRLAEATRTLWIDAICIDQSNVPERNHQMTLMTRIYRTASRVVIYLGAKGDEDNSDGVMNWLQETYAPSRIGEKPAHPYQDNILRFLRRRWFTRVWVLQEIQVATAAVAICGEKEVDWEAFRQLSYIEKYARIEDKHVSYTARSLLRPKSLFYHSWRPPYAVRLLRLLESTRDFDATDPRDKLFAILPLLDWESQEHRDANPNVNSIEDQPISDVGRVDYSRSAAEIFTQVSRNLIDAIGLDVLRTVISPTGIPYLPSWATDWASKDMYYDTGPNERGRRGYEQMISGSLYERDARSSRFVDVKRSKDHAQPPAWSFSDYISSEGLANTQLHICGGLIGNILKLGEQCDIHENKFPLQQWESLCDPIHLKMREAPLTGWRKPVSPFVEVLSEDTGIDKFVYWLMGRIKELMSEQLHKGNCGFKPAERPEMLPVYNRNVGTTQELGTKTPLLRQILRGRGGPPATIEEQTAAFLSRSHGRRFFITSTGLIGLAPGAAKVGDQIIGIAGSTVPFVVRPLESHARAFQLVGFCVSERLLDSVGTYEDMLIQ